MSTRAALGVLLAAALAAVPFCAPAPAAAQPLRTALFEPDLTFASGDVLLDRTVDAGASAVRVVLGWKSIAPTTLPVGFDAADPASAGYNWGAADRLVARADARGVAVIFDILDAPDWALAWPQVGMARTLPDPVMLGQFALAAAKRYSGNPGAKPRVRYWQVWNEPNISLFLGPQFLAGQPIAATWYRNMVNQVADSVKSVHADNLVVAGGTAPFFDNTPAVTAVDPDWGPLSFMRAVLCLGPNLKPTCSQTTRFDIWGHDPYTSGGPMHHAALANDVSLADLPKMRATLEAAQLAGHVTAPARAELWAVEFSWDSNPPDPNGVPEPLLSRWTSEALYRMWSSGVSLVTWFLLRDQPIDSSPYQSGLYTRGATVADDTPKPVLQAFRFPVVAFARRSQVGVWGRTPGGKPGTVTIERTSGSSWTALGTVTTDANGIFRATYVTWPGGSIRARDSFGATSAPFSLTPVPDQIFNPFGNPWPLEQTVTPTRPPLPPHEAASSTQRITIETRLRGG